MWGQTQTTGAHERFREDRRLRGPCYGHGRKHQARREHRTISYIPPASTSLGRLHILRITVFKTDNETPLPPAGKEPSRFTNKYPTFSKAYISADRFAEITAAVEENKRHSKQTLGRWESFVRDANLRPSNRFNPSRARPAATGRQQTTGHTSSHGHPTFSIRLQKSKSMSTTPFPARVGRRRTKGVW